MAVELTSTLHHNTYAAIAPTRQCNSAAGKTVIISGGTGGIGYSIARAFCEAGAAVVVVIARRQEALDEASKTLQTENARANRMTEIWTYLLDIKNTEEAGIVFQSIRKRLNGGKDGARDADVLVANAAVLSQGETTLDFDPEVYRDAFETNVNGNLNLVRAFLTPEIPAIPITNLRQEVKKTTPLQYPSHQKVVIDISTAACFYSIPGQAPYTASKLAFTRILRTLYSEVIQLDGTPIRIHSLSPGLVWTPGVSKLVDQNAGFMPWDDVSLPSHFAVWLASSAAAFTNGRFLSANWNVNEIVAKKRNFEEDLDFCSITLKI